MDSCSKPPAEEKKALAPEHVLQKVKKSVFTTSPSFLQLWDVFRSPKNWHGETTVALSKFSENHNENIEKHIVLLEVEQVQMVGWLGLMVYYLDVPGS